MARAHKPRPARGYSWPPFEAGNLAAVRHGASSERLVAETMSEIEAHVLPRILSLMPWLSDPAFEPDVRLLMRDMAVERRLSDYVLSQPIDKISSRSIEMRNQASRNLRQHLHELGLSPKGYAALRELLATTEHAELSVETLRERARRAREARETARDAREARTVPEPAEDVL